MQIPGLLLRALGEGTRVSAVNGCPSPSQFKCRTRSDQKPVDEQPWSVIGFLYKMRRWDQQIGRGVLKSKTGRILKERRVKDPSQQLKLEGTFTIITIPRCGHVIPALGSWTESHVTSQVNRLLAQVGSTHPQRRCGKCMFLVFALSLGQQGTWQTNSCIWWLQWMWGGDEQMCVCLPFVKFFIELVFYFIIAIIIFNVLCVFFF